MRAFLWLIIFNFICVPAPPVPPATPMVQTGSYQPQPQPQPVQQYGSYQPQPVQPAAPIVQPGPYQPQLKTPIQSIPIQPAAPLSPIISQPLQSSQPVQTLYASIPQQSGVTGQSRSQSVIAQPIVAPQTQTMSQPPLYPQPRQSIPPPPGTVYPPQVGSSTPQQQPGGVLGQMGYRLNTASQGLAQLQGVKSQLQGVKSQASQAIGQLKRAVSLPGVLKNKVKMPKMRRTKSTSNLNSKKKSKKRRAYIMLFPIVIILFCVLCCSLCVIINICWTSMIGIITSYVFDKIRRNREFYESGDDIHAYSVVKIEDC